MPLLLGLALIVLQPAPAASAPSTKTAPSEAPTSAPVASAQAAKNADPVICQQEEVTGSVFPKRTCRRRSEWTAASKDSDGLRDVQREQNQRMANH